MLFKDLLINKNLWNSVYSNKYFLPTCLYYDYSFKMPKKEKAIGSILTTMDIWLFEVQDLRMICVCYGGKHSACRGCGLIAMQ